MNHFFKAKTDTGSLLKRYHYRNEALRAAGHGKDFLMFGWSLAADAAKNYSRQCQKNEILSSLNLPDLEKTADALKKKQEATYRLTMALEASPMCGFSSYWIFEPDEFKEVGSSYRYWMNYSQARDTIFVQREIAQAQEAAAKYNLSAPVVSHFAQEAVRCFQHAQKIQQSSLPLLEKDLVVYRWKIAAYEAVHSALMQQNLAMMKISGEKMAIDSCDEVATFAAQAVDFRIKAAEATEHQDELTALHWSLAAYHANNVCDAHAELLELSSSEDNLLVAYWRKALYAAKEATRIREKIVVSERKSASWQQSVFWSEHYYDCCCNVVETYFPKNVSANALWEEAAQEAKRVASFWIQAAEKKEQCKISLSAIYYEKRASHAAGKHRKKILELLSKEIFFCMPQQLLPEEVFQNIREKKEFPLKIDYSTFHNWIYQSWKLLRDEGVRCNLFPQPVTYGIMITQSDGLSSSFGKDSMWPEDLFFVDVVADKKAHPAAHCYLLQNSAHSTLVPNSSYMPHWPQPGLVPRSAARGACFKNVCFFGEPQNLIPEMRAPEWAERLEKELGLHFKIRGFDQWYDYSEVDCIVAIRGFSLEAYFDKPSTKLYNAWLAGVPFIGGRDSAYAAEGHSGENYLVATSLEEVFQHLKRLKEDAALRSMLVENGFESGKAFTREKTLEQWKKFIQETLPALVQKRQKEIERKRCQKLISSFFFR